MYSQLNAMLVQARLAEISRGSMRQGERRSSVRIQLEARRARRQSRAG
ncbi:MAG: hypothetical protein QOE58_2698 [Actinomycetota bacterium]|jgi:hypothetical protein|nr:hypothetical protein [Actinomycetota bacterium]